MPKFAEYLLIGGTMLLLGGAVLSFLAVVGIRVYVTCRFGANNLRRYESYAQSEAPKSYHLARFCFFRLIYLAFALVLFEIVFASIVFWCFAER